MTSLTFRLARAALVLALLAGCQTRERTETAAPAEPPADTITTAIAGPDTSGHAYAGTWTATLPTGTGAGRLFALELAKNGPARLRFDHRSAELPVLESGTWQPLPDGRLRVTLDRRGGDPIGPDTILFRPDAGRLLAMRTDVQRWGPADLVFLREEVAQDTTSAGSKDVAALLGRKWMWVRTASTTGTVVAPDPADYTFVLDTDGRVSVQADCNRGVSGYTLDGSAIEFRPVALTRRGCPPGSQGERFASQLSQGRHWALHGDTLALDLVAHSGTMHFIAAQ